MIRFDRDFIKDMKENKDIEKNERRLRIIRDALFIVIPLIIIVFIFLTYIKDIKTCLLYTSPSPRDVEENRMPSSA